MVGGVPVGRLPVGAVDSVDWVYVALVARAIREQLAARVCVIAGPPCLRSQLASYASSGVVMTDCDLLCACIVGAMCMQPDTIWTAA
jgi:hypothetical protein